MSQATSESKVTLQAKKKQIKYDNNNERRDERPQKGYCTQEGGQAEI